MFYVSTSPCSLKSWNDKQKAQLQRCEHYWSQSWDCLSFGKFNIKGSPRKLVDGKKTSPKPNPSPQACPQILCKYITIICVNQLQDYCIEFIYIVYIQNVASSLPTLYIYNTLLSTTSGLRIFSYYCTTKATFNWILFQAFITMTNFFFSSHLFLSCQHS